MSGYENSPDYNGPGLPGGVSMVLRLLAIGLAICVILVIVPMDLFSKL